MVCFAGVSIDAAQVYAEGSNKPLILKDGNGTFLGNIISARGENSFGATESYTTYFPAVNGILSYIVDDFAHTVTFGNKYAVFYTQSNCQGTGYAGQSDSVQSQWIRQDYNGNFFKKGAPVTVTAVSTYGDEGCVNADPETIDTYEIIPVTLAAGVGSPALPVTVSEQSPSAPPATIRKSANESITSSTLLQNDDQFTFQLQAGKTYVVQGVVIASSPSGTPDIKIAFTDPLSSDMNMTYVAGSGAYGVLQTSGDISSRINLPANNLVPITISGTIVAGADGSLQLQWAQFASNANAVSVLKGSYLKVTEIQ